MGAVRFPPRFLAEEAAPGPAAPSLAASVATAPERLVGLGMIPMQSPALAVGELRRCMRMGLAGVQIGTNVRADAKRPAGHGRHDARPGVE